MSGEEQLREKLVLAAQRAAQEAYAPYSGFRVGAAIMSADGKMYPGCNVENECTSLGTCAERCAVAAMVVDGSRQIERVAVFSPDSFEVFPCGACRQILFEFGCREVLVVESDHGIRRYSFPDELLPHAFKKSRRNQ